MLVIRVQEDRNLRSYSFEPTIDQKKQEIEAEFIHENAEELNTVYKSDDPHRDMELMRKAIERLKDKYEEAKRKAMVFGIDLEDSKIDSLVKGRQFELFAASIWHNDNRTTIEDWTPDKGIHEGIYIRSNGNPDFTISIHRNGDTKIVAVECKYRGRYYYNQEKRTRYLLLDESRKINRYKNFQDESGFDVYLLLGVTGDSSQPESLYLLNIDDVIFIKHDHQYYEKEYYSIEKHKLNRYIINKHELVDRLM